MDGSEAQLGITWLLTQGVLGFTTLVFMYISYRLYTGKEAERLRFEGLLLAKDQAHDIEMAQWIKLNQDLQAEQRNELRVQNERLASNSDLVRQLWQAKGGRLDQAV